MGAAIITLTKAIVFIVTALSAIIAFYGAENAMAGYTNIDVFWSGLVLIIMGVLVGPLFCVLAGYGMVDRLGIPPLEASLLIAPAFLAWSGAALRLLYDAVVREPTAP